MTIVAAIQMCSTHQLKENLASAAKLIATAAQQQAKLIILPEMFAAIDLPAAEQATMQETPGCGEIQQFLATQAAKHQVWLLGGTMPMRSEQHPQKIKAASLLYDDQGNLAARYDKIHLFDVQLSATEYYRESNTTDAGDQIVVVDTPMGKLGLAVCYDIRFPAMFTRLLQQGAEIIAIPSAFTVKTGQAHWHILTRSRAIETSCYVIGACQGGTHSNQRQTYGHSLIVEPWGSIVDECSTTGNGIAYATLDLEYLHHARKTLGVATKINDGYSP